jgi:predicted methyltransferase
MFGLLCGGIGDEAKNRVPDIMKHWIYIFALCLTATWIAAVQADQKSEMAERISQQMSTSDRHRFDLPRDEHRKPYETFRFLGVKSGMTVMDVGAYAGYTTEMLAAAVGPDGKVFSQNTEQVYLNYAEGYYKRAMDERLASDRLPNVVLHIAEYDDLGFEGKLDLAFLGNLIHDFQYRDGEEKALAFLASIRLALKPGGVLGVMDHVGVAGRDNAKLHRIEPDHARELLRKAGFFIEAESDLFANPGDDHSLMVYDEAIYRRTDRFLFKAVKLEE